MKSDRANKRGGLPQLAPLLRAGSVELELDDLPLPGLVVARPATPFPKSALDKWKDGRNRDKIERVLPQVADVAKRMGY